MPPEECTCEFGYYCRFCRLIDRRDEQIRLDKLRAESEETDV